MKRDMDLIRELLLKLEALPIPSIGFRMIQPDEAEVQVEGYTVEQIDYHLSLLEQANLISAGGLDVLGMKIGPGTAFRSLSWAGHDFLDSVRSPDVWEKTRKVAAAAGGLTIDLLMATAKTYLEVKVKGLIGG
jgi:Hypothetical protein (DUF2513)